MVSKLSYYDLLTIALRAFLNISTKDNHILARSSCNDKTERGITDLVTVPTVTFESNSNIRPNGDVNDKRRPFGENVR